MTIFLESPYPAIVFLVLAEALLAVVLIQTGSGKAILGMLGVLLFSAVLFFVERAVVTPFEEVEQYFDQVAPALETNDVDHVLEFISPDARVMRASLRSRMPAFTIHKVRIGNDLAVTFNHTVSPPKAEATFTGRITVSDHSGVVSNANFVRKFTVKLRQENGRWMAYDYEERQPFGKKL